MSHNEFAADSPRLVTHVLDLIGACWISQAICAAAELGIADLIAGGCRSVDELASAAHCDRNSLQRLLRALATLELCVEHDDGSFVLTPGGRLLCSDSPSSIRANAIWWGRYLWPVWEGLADSIRTGVSARKLRSAQTGFAHLEDNPEAAAVFNRKMAELTHLAASAIMRLHDFARAQSVVDIGGGHGELLMQILQAYPNMRGVLFDLPHAIEGARERFADGGLTSRSKCIAGNFFEEVPALADVYLLKNVLHNWDDDDCVRILQNCRRAMEPTARLLIVEFVRPRRAGVSATDQAIARTDINMLIGPGGCERMQGEIDTLLEHAGLQAIRADATALGLWVIEAGPALTTSTRA
jgi:orsellinic acid C2-O-methyltransferase